MNAVLYAHKHLSGKRDHIRVVLISQPEIYMWVSHETNCLRRGNDGFPYNDDVFGDQANPSSRVAVTSGPD